MQLGPGITRLPSGAELLAQGDWLRVHVGRSGAIVNDVEVHGSTTLHPGDVLAEAGLEYLVLPASTPNLGRVVSPLEHWTWFRRVEEEVAASERTLSILVGRSGAFVPDFIGASLAEFTPQPGVRHIVGAAGRNVVEVLFIGEPTGIDPFRQFLSDRAARAEETVRWGLANFPRNGATAEELWSVAADRLLGLDSPEPAEFAWSDPCMSRLRAFSDRWSRRRALALLGAEGVGRESLARFVRATAAPGAPFIVHRGARFDAARWSEDVARAVGGALHVRRPEMLPESERRAFWNARNFCPSVGAAMTVGSSLLPADQIIIPDLTNRPADIVLIAERVVHSVDAQLGRRRSSLRAETRALLQRLAMPENVRTLRSVVTRGALNATGAEVRPEHLDPPVGTPALGGVRTVIRETERRELESVLLGSGWNVTEAARRMDLPRRTLIYRMSRLGLRRPDHRKM